MKKITPGILLAALAENAFALNTYELDQPAGAARDLAVTLDKYSINKYLTANSRLGPDTGIEPQ